MTWEERHYRLLMGKLESQSEAIGKCFDLINTVSKDIKGHQIKTEEKFGKMNGRIKVAEVRSGIIATFAGTISGIVTTLFKGQ